MTMDLISTDSKKLGISHLGNLEIEDGNFEKEWEELSKILISIGIRQEDLDFAKAVKLEETPVQNDFQKANQKKAEELKNLGNGLFKQKKFQKAIETYTEAILIPELPSVDLAILYANRSVAYLKTGDVHSAKDDAKGVIHLRPNWWKGYARLANCYQELKKYKEALVQNEIALSLEPGAVDVREGRDFCRHMVAKLKREEHMDSANYIQTFEDCAEASNRLGFDTNAFEVEMHNKIGIASGTAIGMCGEAHNYLHGRGVAQNYQMAAIMFAKAAGKGNAEGLYNLAILTREGNGVTRSIRRSHEMLLQAAEQEPFKEIVKGSGLIVPNIGVMEAQHALGLAYENGVGVDQDFDQALSWYEKALRNGSGNSGNNIAMAYSQGVHVAVDFPKAFLYWKIASLKKCVRAMENLAHTYWDFGDVANSQKWYLTAKENGSTSLDLWSEKFAFEPIQFNSQDFLNDIKEELSEGPLSAFVLPHEHGYENLAKKLAEMMQNPISDYKTTIIVEHRAKIKDMKSRGAKPSYTANPGKLKPEAIPDLIGLKVIYLKDMDQTKDHIYEGYALKLILIEDASVGNHLASIGLIGQDENGDVQRIYVYNYEGKDAQDVLGFGSRITIVNPYFRITLDKKPAIRVDDPTLLFPNTKLRNLKLCRYCGLSIGTFPCRTCKRVFYCSKLCLKKDGELFQHHLVCFKRF